MEVAVGNISRVLVADDDASILSLLESVFAASEDYLT
jgi:hypothetical protein